MNFLLLLAKISQIATVAQSFVPLFAVAHQAVTPDASNQGLAKASQVISAAQGLIAVGEAEAAKAVSAGAAAPTGLQKLAVAQSAVQSAHDLVVQSGGTTATFDEIWTPLNAAITAICAAKSQAAEQAALIS